MYKRYLEPKLDEESYKYIRLLVRATNQYDNIEERLKRLIKMGKDYFSINKLALWLGVSVRTIYRLYDNPELISPDMYKRLNRHIHRINLCLDYETYLDFERSTL